MTDEYSPEGEQTDQPLSFEEQGRQEETGVGERSDAENPQQTMSELTESREKAGAYLERAKEAQGDVDKLDEINQEIRGDHAMQRLLQENGLSLEGAVSEKVKRESTTTAAETAPDKPKTADTTPVINPAPTAETVTSTQDEEKVLENQEVVRRIKEKANEVIDDFRKFLAFSRERAEDIDKYARKQFAIYGDMTDQVRDLLQTLLPLDDAPRGNVVDLNFYFEDIDRITVYLKDLEAEIDAAKSAEEADEAIDKFNSKTMRSLSESFDHEGNRVMSNPLYGENTQRQFAEFRRLVDDYRSLSLMSGRKK